MADEIGISFETLELQHELRKRELIEATDCQPNELLGNVEAIVKRWNETKWSW
jgi:hypothetical protein